MRFAFKVFISHCSSKRLLLIFKSCSSVLLGVLLALTAGTIIFTSSLRYPYAPYLTVSNIVSSDATTHPVCGRLDHNASLVRYDILKPLGRPNFECIRTKTSPSVTICLFDIWHDVYVSRSLRSAGIWEPYLVYEFTEAVTRGGPRAGVVDIGANIGYYTLLAAKLGQQVVAVEPVLDSIQRLQHAAHIEQLMEHITVVYNGIADVRRKATLRQSGHNQGDSRIELRVQECTGACPVIINTIILDDLVDVIPFSQAVLKIDIQGSEHVAFQCAKRLFDNIHFTHIFMEWEIMRDFFVDSNHMSHDKLLVEQMISFLLLRNFVPYELIFDGAKPLDPNRWSLWPINIVWLQLANTDELSYLTRSHHKNWPG